MADSDSYQIRGPLRMRQPQTYYPLPLLAACVDFSHTDSMKCPWASDDESDEDRRAYHMGLLHRKLLRAARNRDGHSLLLDQVLGELLPDALTCRPEEYEGMCVGCPQAQQILSRFARVQQRISKIPLPTDGGILWDKIVDATWFDEYIIPEGREALKQDMKLAETNIMAFLGDRINRPWYFFYVTNIMDTNSILFLLHLANALPDPPERLVEHLFRYVDLLAALIDQHDSLTGLKTFVEKGTAQYETLEAAGFFDFEDPKAERQACEIVRYFLYSAWSRSVMLLFYTTTGRQLACGSSQRWSRFLAVQGVHQLEELDNLSLGRPVYSAGLAPDYLCNWSLELLRRSRCALCLDFRTLLRRYSEQFPDWPGRCKLDSTKPCEGDDPSSCGRFTQAQTKSQTAHSSTCEKKRCRLIKWNESSYLGVKGPRAVLVDAAPGKATQLHYTKATKTTMAVSHVWAHGQGGRPEDGVNICLHQRYTELARRFNCDSYWIDSACIPSETNLRREAIFYINQIFTDSKAVLISDKDLQEVSLEDERDDITWKAQILVSVLLVCDWNVRAWTLLEAFRGSKSTRILCKDDQTVPLIDVLRLVWEIGPIDLAVLMGSMDHLLPFAQGEDRKSVEDAAAMLSQRHASRPGDEIIIWCLLNKRPPNDDPITFWQGTPTVNTAFLLSSTPRIQDSKANRVPGLSWAPATPISSPQLRNVQVSNEITQKYTIRHPVYDGNGSFVGRISTNGLRAVWSYIDFTQEALEEYRNNFCEVINPDSEWANVDEYDDTEHILKDVYSSPDTALLCEVAEKTLSHQRLVRILRAASSDGRGPYHATENRGDVSGPAAALVSSGDGGETWIWHDVYQHLDVAYWKWSRAEMLIA